MSLSQPLQGIRIIEFEGIGPGPIAGRMLAGLGADVTAVVRKDAIALAAQFDTAGDNPLRAGKRVLALDLKRPEEVAEALDLVAAADGLIEGHRPGVMERLGLGPSACAERNPRLVYGRLTGWGQDGPLAQAAGHDLNYVALTGLLSLSARPGQSPILPPTVVGDAVGALGLCFGMTSALVAVRSGGAGRVVDAAIVDIGAMLGMLAQLLHAGGQLGGPQPSAFHDSPFYDCYACADGGFVTVAALEPQFYALLLDRLGLNDVDPTKQYDRHAWPATKARFAATFLTRTRDEWCALLEGSDACFAPVLTLGEAVRHPHNVARGTYRTGESGTVLPAPAPRFGPL